MAPRTHIRVETPQLVVQPTLLSSARGSKVRGQLFPRTVPRGPGSGRALHTLTGGS